MQRRDDERPPEHDYEAQPESAELGESVQQDPEVTLVGPPGTDPLDAGYIPPDRPYGLDDVEVTGAHETLDDRLRREQPEESFTNLGRPGRLVIADAIRASRARTGSRAASRSHARHLDSDDLPRSSRAKRRASRTSVMTEPSRRPSSSQHRQPSVGDPPFRW